MSPAPSLSRQLAAEALGTGLLVATVVGSGIMAERLTTDGAVALLANSLPTVASLVVLIVLFGPLSGAHFNPVVSLVEALRGRLSWQRTGAFILVQLAGGVTGTLLAHLMFDLPLVEISDHVRRGSGQWVAEGVATFGLILTILIGSQHRPAWVPALVGLYVGAGYWFTASTCFANPAVTLARTLTATFSGIRPVDLPFFVLAQIAGAVLALLVALWLVPQTRSESQ